MISPFYVVYIFFVRFSAVTLLSICSQSPHSLISAKGLKIYSTRQNTSCQNLAAITESGSSDRATFETGVTLAEVHIVLILAFLTHLWDFAVNSATAKQFDEDRSSLA